jgi:hypothetical protein
LTHPGQSFSETDLEPADHSCAIRFRRFDRHDQCRRRRRHVPVVRRADLAGIPPVVANATSSITQFPGYITSTLAYWDDFKTFWRGAVALASDLGILGSLAGAWILLRSTIHRSARWCPGC